MDKTINEIINKPFCFQYHCDRLPLEVISTLINSNVLWNIYKFQETSDDLYLETAITEFLSIRKKNIIQEILDVSKIIEDLKNNTDTVGERINKAIQHYLNWINNSLDEMQGIEFTCELLLAIWTYRNYPELNDFTQILEVEK